MEYKVSYDKKEYNLNAIISFDLLKEILYKLLISQDKFEKELDKIKKSNIKRDKDMIKLEKLVKENLAFDEEFSEDNPEINITEEQEIEEVEYKDKNKEQIENTPQRQNESKSENEKKEEKEDKEEKSNNKNYLLNEEVKSLKEQLENQAHNLLRLTALENQIHILQLENENLKQKKQNGNDDLSLNDRYAHSEIIKHSLTSDINNSPSKKVKKRLSITIVKDKQNNNEIKNNAKTLDKTETVIKPKENEKMNENEKNLADENEKLKDEITKLKVKHLNMEFENESKLVKLKNIIKNIEKQCNKLGVKIDFNFNNLL